MEEEAMLKNKYNDLLKSLEEGQKYLEEHPKSEKAQTRLQEIAQEMENIINAMPDMTAEEKANGFKNVEQVNDAVTIVPQKRNVVKKEENQVQIFNDNWEMAARLAKSSLLPDEFKNKPENVVIALGMSQKMQLDPFTVMQNLHIIRGKLSWSGAFCKTLIEQSGQYKDLDLIYVGKENTEERGCYLQAVRIRDGKIIKGNTVTTKLAKDEGWYSKNTKWKTMTEQMLGYRAMAFFARLYCPEVLNGVMTSEENYDADDERQQPQDIL